jgi:hypothetical protein
MRNDFGIFALCLPLDFHFVSANFLRALIKGAK